MGCHPARSHPGSTVDEVNLDDQTIVITGGARGIGAALAERFLTAGARHVALVDVLAEVEATADRLGQKCSAFVADVADPVGLEAVVGTVEQAHGDVGLFCANAGIATGADVFASPEVWQQTWRTNVFAHVVAAQTMLPRWLERGAGHLLVTASAAGLLTNLGDAPYSVTKHAAVALAEWLAVTYGDRGLHVACLCPQGVRTPMLMGGAGELGAEVVLAQGTIEPSAVADAVVDGLTDGRFLILPHPEVAGYYQRRATDTDRWLAGMRKLQARIDGSARDHGA